MSVLIYTEQAGDKLKLLAEVGEDNVELAVDALLDAEPKLVNQLPFVIFPVDSRLVIHEASEEIVRPRRDYKISGGDANGKPQRKPRAARVEQTEPQVEEGEVETDPAPATQAPRRRGRPAKSASKGAAKPAAKRSTAKKPAAKASGKKASPFTRNPKSDE